ncbi:hypothetical protein PCYB_006240 [Plasmodium cynomolgi strain B]|uniref:PIR Superfamily Protein n=1 Tax=Plasmodium cynomolgi (strain B) TaxID=1120755 RepID=K6V3D4_PLACD|nr:hypothetical protein PCYB_006240 [Plasmodium cynomolgi strain B]GAB69875.1 hypothetical protein PCYB_006240 [Plasmodium cynomolgi strain B]
MLLNKFFEEIGILGYCKDHTEAIDEDTYNDLKKLDELYESFYNFEKESPTEYHNRCEKGKKYVQEYENHKDTCNGNGNNSFCNELNNFRVIFNNQLESIKKCDNIEELPSFQRFPLSATIIVPVSLISVIIFFSFITYKYTPIGSWINPKLMKQKRYFNELLQEHENTQNSSYRRSYNIAYTLSE